jgi:hypothetical protein
MGFGVWGMGMGIWDGVWGMGSSFMYNEFSAKGNSSKYKGIMLNCDM